MHLQPELQTVLIAVVGWIILKTYFHVFEATWPERYFSGKSGLDPVISRSPARYLFFRITPVFFALIVVGTTAHRLDLERSTAIWITAALHALIGPASGFIEAIGNRPIRIGIALHRLGVVAGTVASALAAIHFGRQLDRLVPDMEDVVLAAWVALFIFIASRVGLMLTASAPSSEDLVERARAEIPEHLLLQLRRADPSGAFETVAIVEHLNRPRWVRWAERNFVRRNGSYGLMQIRSRYPLTDEQSVEKFIRKYRRVQIKAHQDGRIKTFFERHNSTLEFVKLARELHFEVAYSGEYDEIRRYASED